jgi:hypothetical protein
MTILYSVHSKKVCGQKNGFGTLAFFPETVRVYCTARNHTVQYVTVVQAPRGKTCGPEMMQLEKKTNFLPWRRSGPHQRRLLNGWEPQVAGLPPGGQGQEPP